MRERVFIPSRGVFAEALGWVPQWWSPWLIVVAGVVVTAGGLIAWRRGVRRCGLSGRVLWLEIVLGARTSELGGVEFARLLIAGLSSSRHRGGSRVSLELWAEAGQTRIGVWVPSRGAAQGVSAAIRHTMPGASVRAVEPPRLGTPSATQCWQLSPKGGPWAVLTEGGRSGGSARRAASITGARARAEGVGPEPLRAVFSALTEFAACRATMAGIQVVIGAAGPSGGLLLGEGFTGGRFLTLLAESLGALARDAARWGLRAAVAFLAEVVFGLVDALVPGSGPRSRRTSAGTGRAVGSGGAAGLARYAPPTSPGAAARPGDGGGLDPVAALGARARVAKRAAGPHARVSVRVLACDVPDRAARGLAWEVANSYALALPQAQLRPSRLRRCDRTVRRRRVSRFFWVTVEELAALWHVPANAAEFDLPEAPARTRPGGRGVPRPRSAEANRYLPPFSAPTAAAGRTAPPAGTRRGTQSP
jgi:hypothetical protein